MVRNEGGGNKMKHLARKHVNGASQSQANKFLRVAQCKEERYAYIVRLLGNSMCMVKCVDGYERLCHIRGKFTGRSKRENALAQGTWVLIGLRQWDADKEFASKATKTDKKMIQKCDLLEIYSASEREKLRVQEKIFQDVVECNNSDEDGDGDDEFKTNSTVEFKDTKTLEYQEIVAQGGKLTKLSNTTSYQNIYDQISDSDDSDSDDDSDNSDDDTTPTHAPTRAPTHATHAPTPAPTHAPKKPYSCQLEEVDIDDI